MRTLTRLIAALTCWFSAIIVQCDVVLAEGPLVEVARIQTDQVNLSFDFSPDSAQLLADEMIYDPLTGRLDTRLWIVDEAFGLADGVFVGPDRIVAIQNKNDKWMLDFFSVLPARKSKMNRRVDLPQIDGSCENMLVDAEGKRLITSWHGENGITVLKTSLRTGLTRTIGLLKDSAGQLAWLDVNRVLISSGNKLVALNLQHDEVPQLVRKVSIPVIGYFARINSGAADPARPMGATKDASGKSIHRTDQVAVWGVDPVPERPELVLQVVSLADNSVRWQNREAPELWDIACSTDGQWVVGAGRDGKAYVWKVSDGTLAQTPRVPGEHGVKRISFSPDGSLLAGMTDSHIIVWRIEDSVQASGN